MPVVSYPIGTQNSHAAILAIGDSWFWYPRNNLIQEILALNELRDDYKTARVLGNNGALLSEYRTGTYAKEWRNELKGPNFKFSLVLISGGGNDSVDFGFALKKNCSKQTEPAKCFDEGRLRAFVDAAVGLMASLIFDVQMAAERAQIRTPTILLNGYDRPVPDGRAFSMIPGVLPATSGPWIADKMDTAKVPTSIEFRTQVIGHYIDVLNSAIQHLASRTTGVYCPTQLGVLSTAKSTYKTDWDNELHPSRSGFKKIARQVWLPELAKLGFTRA